MERTASDLELKNAVGRLAGQAEDWSREARSLRHLPEALVNEMAANGFFRMLTPRAIDGLEMEPWAAAEAVEALSRVDGSLGWCAMIGSQSSWYASFLPRQVAAEVAGGMDARVAGALRPGGAARHADGGFVVSGRWAMASGSTYARWLYGTAVVEAREPGEALAARVFYVRAEDVELVDSWHTVGLRGTGSCDFFVREVAVPEERSLLFPELARHWDEGPLYRDPVQNLVYVLQGAHALGVASASLESFVELAGPRTRWVDRSALRDHAAVQRDVGGAMAALGAARALLREATGDVWESLVAGDRPGVEARRRLRLAITHAITTSHAVVDSLHAMAGSAAVYEEHPLQRQLQDLIASRAHVQAAPAMLELAGAGVLGADHMESPALL